MAGRTMTRAACVVVIAACGSPAQVRPLEGRATTPAPSTPAPYVLRGGDYGLTAEGLPATAGDGRAVVIAVRDSDGLRGLPNLTVVVRDRRDALVADKVVLSVAEADQMLDDASGANPALDARIAAANAWLRDLHATHRLVPLTRLEPDAGYTPSERRRATGGDVTVAWIDDTLRITRGETLLVSRNTPKTWLVDDYPIGTGDTCSHPAYLGGAAIDLARAIAVVTISYAAPSDMCDEPSDVHHVIAW